MDKLVFSIKLRNHLKLQEKGGQFSTKKLGRPTALLSAQETERYVALMHVELLFHRC